MTTLIVGFGCLMLGWFVIPQPAWAARLYAAAKGFFASAPKI